MVVRYPQNQRQEALSEHCFKGNRAMDNYILTDQDQNCLFKTKTNTKTAVY